MFAWIARVLRLAGAARYGHVMAAGDGHLRLQQAFTECAGLWVAMDRRTGEVVAARQTPYELSAYIREKQLRGVDILRAPAENEPEVVGFG